MSGESIPPLEKFAHRRNGCQRLWLKGHPLGTLFEISLGGTPSRKKQEYWNGDIPWVSSGEVAFSRIKRTREQITDVGLRDSSARLNPPGTVLLAMIGEGKTRGQPAILDIAASNNQNVTLEKRCLIVQLIDQLLNLGAIGRIRRQLQILLEISAGLRVFTLVLISQPAIVIITTPCRFERQVLGEICNGLI